MKFTFIIYIIYTGVNLFSSENWTGSVCLTTSLKKIGVRSDDMFFVIIHTQLVNIHDCIKYVDNQKLC